MVGYVDKKGEHGLIVLVPQKGQQWLSRFLRVGIPQKECGKENTRLILEFVQRQGLKAEAAECCANYAHDGVKAGEAFCQVLMSWNVFMKIRGLLIRSWL